MVSCPVMKLQPDRTRPSAIWLAGAILSAGWLCARGEEPESVSAEIEVHVLDWNDTQARIQSEHRGRVVVVNLWTNTCPACLEGFPEFAGLLDRFDREELTCVSLNCDYDGVPGKPPAHYRPAVIKFLEQQRNGIDHVMLSDPLIDFMDAVKLNSTPALFVFNRDGKLVRRFDNDQADSAEEEFTMDQVEAAVRALLHSRE